MIVAPLVLLVLAAVFVGFFLWSRRQGLVDSGSTSPGVPSRGRISLLTEAVAYVGAILILAGGVAAIGQRWNDLPLWQQVGIWATGAVFFLAVGLFVRGVPDPAAQRLVGVVWLLSVMGVTGTVVFATQDGGGPVVALQVGAATAAYAAVLWWFGKRALLGAVLFAGLVMTVVGAVGTLTGEPVPSLPVALSLWLLGLVWALLGWRRYLEPIWVSTPLGVLLALLAPSFTVGDHGWMYLVGLGTAAAAMGLSVPLRNTPLLGLGTVAMFGYVTSIVVRYFGDSLGVPAALALTGVVILVLAAVTARLVRMSHAGPKLEPQRPAGGQPEQPAPPAGEAPGQPPRRRFRKAS